MRLTQAWDVCRNERQGAMVVCIKIIDISIDASIKLPT